MLNSSIDNLNWSDEATDIINMFHDADIMVYVEGVDDIGFWEIIFEKNGHLKVEIQDVGGCEALTPYVDKIVSGKIKAIVARDSDLNFFSSNIIKHPNIIYTKGYSIENTIINDRVILKTLKTLGKYSKKEIQKIHINEWFDDFYNNIESLIILDIYNHVTQRGQSVIGNSCEMFLKSKSSYSICPNKINNYIQKLPDDFKEQEIIKKDTLSLPNSTCLNNWIRGHFLFSSTLKLITNILSKNERKVSISKDSFYSNILNIFELCFTEEHEDYEYYNEKISLIS